MTKQKYIGKSLSRKTYLLIIASSTSLLLAGLLAVFFWRNDSQAVTQTSMPTEPRSSALRYAVRDLPDEVRPKIMDALEEIDPSAKESDNPDVIFNTDTNATDMVYNDIPTPNSSFDANGILLKTNLLAVHFSSDTASSQWHEKIHSVFLQKFQAGGEAWSYLALGDIIPARDVYTHSKRRGYEYPYLKITERSQQYDLTVSNLETTVADGQNYGEGAGMMTFTAPTKALDGLLAAGIDGVSLANNHAMNGGGANVSQMLSDLETRRIGHFGVSPSTNKPFSWNTKVKNISIAHLSYNSIPGSISPTATSPGLTRLDLKPWGSLSDGEVQRVKADIANTKKSTDVMIAWFHWGQEYTHQANDEQKRLAHAAVDAGADVVIGTHPHWTQGVEWYNGHLIAYSLGNFVFDQNWSEETKRSTALALNFSGKTLIGAELLPARIENYVQPRWLLPTEITYRQILTDIKTYSWWR